MKASNGRNGGFKQTERGLCSVESRLWAHYLFGRRFEIPDSWVSAFKMPIFMTVGLQIRRNGRLFSKARPHAEYNIFSLFFLQGSHWRARRRPRLSKRKPGAKLKRNDTRQYPALKYQLPPRFTRREPEEAPVGFCCEPAL